MRPFMTLVLAAAATAADLEQITDFGPNPSNVSYYLYVPDAAPSVAAPPLLVYPHWCHGSALDAFNFKPWRAIADRVGFPIVYPDSPWQADHCWDVSSNETLTRVVDPSTGHGGDSLGIASMVRHALTSIPGVTPDADRVFVVGISSGAMMANVLAATYPDLFAGVAALAGVAHSCFSGPGRDYWNADCAEGRVERSPEEWAARVRAAYPGYDGVRPKMQLMHGTADDVLDVVNYHEEVDMWTAVLGTGSEPVRVDEATPEEGWTKYTYGEAALVEGFLAEGVTHDIPDQVDDVMRFFDLECVGEGCFSRKTLRGRGSTGRASMARTSRTLAPQVPRVRWQW